MSNCRLGELVAKDPVMLFMKGTAEEPRCGFSRKAVAMLQEAGVAFGTFDILSDEEVRQGLKEFSNWPTYPQLYAKGAPQPRPTTLSALRQQNTPSIRRHGAAWGVSTCSDAAMVLCRLGAQANCSAA